MKVVRVHTDLRRTGLSVLFFILIISTLATFSASGVDERWIVAYKVVDLSSKQLALERDYELDRDLQNAPLLAGGEYNITIFLDVGLTAAYANLTLSVNLDHASNVDRYWEIHTTELNLTEDYNPNEAEFKFRQVEGRYSVSTFGKIPSDRTITDLGHGESLHRPVSHKFIQLTGPDGSLLDEIALTVIDSEIDGYRYYLGQRLADLEGYLETQVDPAFTGLFESLIALAEAEAEAGFVGTAQSILESIDIDIPPIRTEATFQEKYFLPVVGGLGALVVILGILFFKANGRLSFTKMIVEDQIRELEGLTLRASRTDRNLGQRLQEINDKLKELEGN
jgi:hypothetical protein